MHSSDALVFMIRRTHAYWERNQFNFPENVTPVQARHIERKLAWWADTFTTPYLDFRVAMRSIAETTYRSNSFDRIIAWSDPDAVAQLAPGTWLVPMDEDDWLRPDFARVLRRAIVAEDGAVIRWSVLRKALSGEILRNPNRFVESCGYALRAPVSWNLVMDHMSVPQVAITIPEALSLRNQTPASLGLFYQHPVESIERQLVAAVDPHQPADVPEAFLAAWRMYQDQLRKLLETRRSPPE